MVVREGSRRGVLCARWEIRVLRGIERFSDYKKINARMRPVIDNAEGIHAPRDRKRGWRSMLSDKVLTTIIAMGTVVLVLLTAATLIVILLLQFASHLARRTGRSARDFAPD